MTEAKLTVPFAIELAPDEVDLLHSAIAGELARCLVAGVMHNERARTRYDGYVALGKRLGLEL